MIQLYDQTTYSDSAAGTHGDCFRATVCTVLQIDPKALPHPINCEGGWNRGFHKALRKMGWDIMMAKFDPELTPKPDWRAEYPYLFIVPRVVIAAGMSPRGVCHSVVWDRFARRMIHDPHPSRDGIKCVNDIYFLMPLRKILKKESQ